MDDPEPPPRSRSQLARALTIGSALVRSHRLLRAWPGSALVVATLLAGCSDPSSNGTGSGGSASSTAGTAGTTTTGTSATPGTSTGTGTGTSTGVLEGADTSSTGSSGAGDSGSEQGCCASHREPGCLDPAVEACVCALDPFCCDTRWDDLCVQSAQHDCGLACMDAGGDCCAPTGGLGCEDVAVSDCVCALDPFCCDAQWDERCVATAQYACMDACGLPPANMGDCCAAQPGPGCADLGVTRCACTSDGDCCLLPWDDHCIALSVSACGIECAGVEPLPACCLVQPTPGCGDAGLERCVCALDSFCCDGAWDGQCVDEAQNACMLDCSGQGDGGTAGPETGTGSGGVTSTG